MIRADESLAGMPLAPPASRNRTTVIGRPTSEQNAEEVAGRGAVLGDFRIIREIGRGGMGVVYEARQLSLDRKVALQRIPCWNGTQIEFCSDS